MAGIALRFARLAVVIGLAAPGLTGCGLKGPLTLPSKSEQVTIRGPGQTTPAAPAGAAAPAADEAATPDPAPPSAAPAPGPAVDPAAPPVPPPPKPRRYDPLPPPPLPAGNPGTSRGG